MMWKFCAGFVNWSEDRRSYLRSSSRSQARVERCTAYLGEQSGLEFRGRVMLTGHANSPAEYWYDIESPRGRHRGLKAMPSAFARAEGRLEATVMKALLSWIDPRTERPH
jgi:hypothetical protein